jgi:hypothetical protein
VETLPCSLRQFVYDDINLDQAASDLCWHERGIQRGLVVLLLG